MKKAEAIKQIIDIMEQCEKKERYQIIIAVGAMYDPDPNDPGDGEPVYDFSKPKILKAV